MEVNHALVDSSVVCTGDKHLLCFLCSAISVSYQWAVGAILPELWAEQLWRPYVLLCFLHPRNPVLYPPPPPE